MSFPKNRLAVLAVIMTVLGVALIVLSGFAKGSLAYWLVLAASVVSVLVAAAMIIKTPTRDTRS